MEMEYISQNMSEVVYFYDLRNSKGQRQERYYLCGKESWCRFL